MCLFLRLLTALTSATLMLALAQAPAMAASQSGTHAFSEDTLRLHNGPGTGYDLTGEIATHSAIKVLRCQKLWCLVDGDAGRGWTYKRNISFGAIPGDWPDGLARYPRGGTVCFYTGTNYTGSQVCLGTGQVLKDLALSGLDNSFASVRVDGTSVDVCRDRFFQSYCERIIQSQPVLDQYLRGALSSIRVY
jgi:hypothetical protein